MKIIKILTVVCLVVVFGCETTQRDRFNYPLIKSMLSLSEEQTQKFDAITSTYTKLGKETYEKFRDDKDRVQPELERVGAKQDAEIKSILNPEQYEIYMREIKIEREGRENNNMQLIKKELDLDSVQQIQFDQTNLAFYKTLIDNHDNYHGKPDVYQQYYQELDVSRKAALQEFLTSEQYGQYITLTEKYNIGKSEH